MPQASRKKQAVAVLIIADNITYEYSDGLAALENISFEIEPGNIVCLAGKNGSGKSTLLSLLCGLFAPTFGTLDMFGLRCPGQEKEIRGISRLVMQDADLQIIGSTVSEDLLIEGDHNSPEHAKLARDSADRIGLGHVWDRPVQTLSWGMRRKLCLASAQLANPKLLLLDEPFSGLDYPGMKEMRLIIDENRKSGRTQIVAVHDMEPLIDLADRIAVLEKGKLVLYGRPEDVLGAVREHGVRPPATWQAGLGIRPWDQHDQ